MTRDPMKLMRLTGGKDRGRKIAFEKLPRLRPTMDKIRKAVFDIVGSRIVDASFLDLFGGTGAIGLEALSRRAGHVVFVDRSKKAYQLIRKNLDLLEWTYRVGALGRSLKTINLKPGVHPSKQHEVIDVYLNDAHAFLKTSSMMKWTFDLIFLDPPYNNDLLKYLRFIEKYGILNDGGRVLCEHQEPLNLDGDAFWKCLQKNRYGDKCVSVVKHV